ncbi:MAG: hypothetical protein AAGI28_00930 [Pseudomonadota bacterium]
MDRLSFLAFAAAYGRVGIVYVAGNELRFHKRSQVASRNVDCAARVAQDMIDRWKPNVIVTEDVDAAVHKSSATKAVTLAIARVAEDSAALNVTIERRHEFLNKSEEAQHLMQKYPALQSINHKPRRFWEKEPRTTVIFEALSLIESVKREPTTRLAQAMG